MGQARLSGVVDVFHLVVAPSSPLVCQAVETLLEHCDRQRWYPSMLVEEHERDPDNRRLALAARGLGVPVVSPRSRRGETRRDLIRTTLDEWFYVRNAHASLLHVHSGSPLPLWTPVRWLAYLMPRLPIIESVYVAGEDGGRVEIGGRGIARRTTMPIRAMADSRVVGLLYDAAASGAPGR